MRVSLLSVIYLFGLLEQQCVGDKHVTPKSSTLSIKCSFMIVLSKTVKNKARIGPAKIPIRMALENVK